MGKKQRGKNLDIQIEKLLQEMLEKGFKAAPISRAIIQRKLDLKSRSTFLSGDRAYRIDQARKQQLEKAGLTSNNKPKRKQAEERIQTLNEEIKTLNAKMENLIEQFTQVINGLHANGLEVEKLLLPLRPNYSRYRKGKSN